MDVRTKIQMFDWLVSTHPKHFDTTTILKNNTFSDFTLGNCDIRVKSKILMMYEMKRNEISQIAKEILA
jgi:hypothetical protein